MITHGFTENEHNRLEISRVKADELRDSEQTTKDDMTRDGGVNRDLMPFELDRIDLSHSISPLLLPT